MSSSRNASHHVVIDVNPLASISGLVSVKQNSSFLSYYHRRYAEKREDKRSLMLPVHVDPYSSSGPAQASSANTRVHTLVL